MPLSGRSTHAAQAGFQLAVLITYCRRLADGDRLNAYGAAFVLRGNRAEVFSVTTARYRRQSTTGQRPPLCLGDR